MQDKRFDQSIDPAGTVPILLICFLLLFGTTPVYGYYESDPALEYVRAAEDLATQFDVDTIYEDTYVVESNRTSLISLLYTTTGETNSTQFNGRTFVEDASWLALSYVPFGTDGVKTEGATDAANRIVRMSATMNLTDALEFKTADGIAETIAEQIEATATSERNKVELANQYLIDHVVYPNTVDDSVDTLWTAYGALANQEAVCQGYASAFNLIMQKLDIPVVNVYGVSDGENHVWNQVLVHGQWLYVDVTFNDPVITGRRPSKTTLAEWNTEYLLLTEEEFYNKGEHVADYYDYAEAVKEVFYRNELEPEAELLKEAGLFLGDESGFRLADGLSRAEMAVMLTRVVGGTQTIDANPAYYTSLCPFTDVPTWAKPYVGYCYSEGLVVGIGNNKYGSTNKASKLDYCTVLLRATGVTTGYTYRTSDVKAVELGYLSEARAAFADLTRGDVVAMTYAYYGFLR